ncbi:hypothetical protein KFU94_11940 [Chloroflexi bacterium TSY]|nr:hypothetical protein [Chloroflexi bacterium TSY]
MLFQGATFLSPETPVALGQELEPLSVPGQLLVGFNPGVSKEEIANFYAEYGLTERDNLDVSHTIQVDQLRLAAAPLLTSMMI